MKRIKRMKRKRAGSFVLMATLVAALAIAPALRAQDAAEDEYQRLAARVAKTDRADKTDGLRQEVMAFKRRHLGTPVALKAAGLLRDLPSPLDKLDAKAIPELERFAWHPKETVAVLGEHKGRQAGALTSVVFSKNSKWLASGSTNGLVRIWDTATMRLKHTVGHGYGAYCLALSKDSGLLATGGGDGHFRLWDTSGDAPKDKGQHKAASTPLLGIAIAPDTKTLACGGSDTRLYLWDLTTEPPKEVSGGSHTGVINAVVYSPSGKVVASGGADKMIRLWSLSDEKKLREGATVDTKANVQCLAFHPTDEKTLVSGGADGVIRVWEVGAKLKEKFSLKVKAGSVTAIAFSATGKTIAAASSDGTAHTWGFGGKFTEKAHLEGHKMGLTAVAFSPDGAFIATGSSDWTVRLWPGTSGIKPRDKTIDKGHLSHVYTTIFNPDGAGFASGSYDKTVRLWDLAAAEPKERHSKLKEEGEIYSLAFSPDGKTLAAGGNNPMFRTCDFATGNFLLGFKEHTGNTARVAWSPDGKTIASCSNDKSFRLWDPLTAKSKGGVATFDAPVNGIGFSPDSKRIACISGTHLYDKQGQLVVKNAEYYYKDSTVRLYEAAGLKELGKWKWDKVLMNSVLFTPDGKLLLAGGSDTQIHQWDALKLPKDDEIFYKWPPPYGVSTMVLSPDGRWLASYGPGYAVQLIDVAARKKVREWSLGEQFGSLAFAPDSRHLAISVATGVTLVLRLDGLKPGVPSGGRLDP